LHAQQGEQCASRTREVVAGIWHERNRSHHWKVSRTIGCVYILLDAGDPRVTGVDPAVATYPTDEIACSDGRIAGRRSVSAAEIARAFGLRRAGRQFAGKCPSCGYASGFSVTERNGVLLYYCHAGGCSQSEVWEALQRAGLAPRKSEDEANKRKRRERAPQSSKQLARSDKPLQTMDNPSKAQAAFAIWRRSRPAEGTTVETYLRTARGYTGPISSALRFAAGKHPSDPNHYHPMMVAAVERDGRIVAIHRTFLRGDGKDKASLDPNKMTLGPCKGAAVLLAPAGPVLAVAEGIETALSYMDETNIPTWAALSAGGIRDLILPGIVEEVIVAADPDPVGIMAALAAAGGWLAQGRRASVARSPLGFDFNDLARGAP
jgi:putative DNA primase/helicase